MSSVKENGVEVASFTYHMDGQIATAKANGRQENFLWDNLALISRNETEYVNEPYVTGGNPILADDKVLFNDMLGSTIGIRSGKEYRETGMTAFGETDEKSAMFTGKPYIGELGYAFLFRNYRPGLGKWQTSDPLGYPDGWNNFAYCNNRVTTSIDFLGTDIYHVVDSEGAILEAGHSAYIIGNPTDGYTAYDYQANGLSGSGSSGSSSNDESRIQEGFATPEAALAYLNSNRTTQEHNFDKGQMWKTSRDEDVAAQAAAAQYMAEDYALISHNCYLLGPKAIISAVNNMRPEDQQIDVSDSPLPKVAFDYNNEHGAIRMQIE